ncbi:hypothetical protein RIF29_11830 [Crotalaria pallida]|uniref:Replication factor A C-terminal domain-containing protein n=1 Tax=Crotalaria pallida TaxID=3830 RepID=A0AAN9IMP1_CROPI
MLLKRWWCFRLVKFSINKVGLFATHATTLMFNPDSIETIKFRIRIDQRSLCDTLPVLYQSGSMSGYAGHFIRSACRRTLASLSEDCMGGPFAIVAKVDHVHIDSQWWLPQCICKGNISWRGSTMWCDLCSRVPLCTKPRNKLKLSVDDGTSQAIFNVFDRDIRYMLGMSCADLISLYYNGQPEAPLLLPPPPYLSTLNSRSFLFKVEQGRIDSGSMRMSFLVSGVAQLSDLIDQLASLPSLVTPAKDTLLAPFSTHLVDGLGNSGSGLLSPKFPPLLPTSPLYPVTCADVTAQPVATTMPCQDLCVNFNVALDFPLVGLKRNYSQIASIANVVQLQPTVPNCEMNDIEVVSPDNATSSASSYHTFDVAIPAKRPRNK